MDGELIVSMRVAEDGRPYVVNPSDSRRVYAKPGEVLKVKVEKGRASHAWTEPENPSLEERRGQTIQELQDVVISRLAPFLEEVVKRLPKLEEGEASKFTVELGVECYGCDDEPYFNTRITTAHEEAGL